MQLVIRSLIVGWLVSYAVLTMADSYSELYQAAGWPKQVEHFHEAVLETQAQYKDVLPVPLYQSLVMSSNRRFEPRAMVQRGEAALREQLAKPQQALNFFQSAVGKKVVNAEQQATTKAELKKYRKSIPVINISHTRQQLVERLIKAIPYEQGTVIASFALTNMAADSLEKMLPGMGLGDTVKQLTPTKEQIQQQIHTQLKPVLINIYRALSDKEFESFVKFAETKAGQAYYQAALAVVMASLNNK